MNLSTHMPVIFTRTWAVVSVVTLTLVIGDIGFVVPKAHAAFGISPPFLNADKLVPGSSYTQTIFLVQDQPNDDMPIEAILDMPQSVRSWFTLSPGEKFIIPKGVRQFGFNVTVKVPKDAGRVSYSGTMLFKTAPKASGQVTIALGAQVNINLIVGNDIYRKLSVPLVRILDIEEGWPSKVYFKINNEGNVPEILDGATFELQDQFGGARLAYIPNTSTDFPEIPPFTIKDFVVEFRLPFRIAIGQYWGSVALRQGDKVIATQRAPFNVLKEGSLSTPLERLWLKVKNNWQISAAIGLILAYAGFQSLRRKLARRRSR